MLTQKFIPYAQQSISAEDAEEVKQALLQTFITRGPLVETFEKAMADYCGSTYAVAFNSGTAALMAAYSAADVGSHDRIVTAPNSFVATIGAGIQRGATPIFVDIDPATGNMDLELLGHNINHPQSKGKTVIVPVHFAGIPVDVQAIDKMIADPATIIIEDAAHALGSHYTDGSKVGSCAFSQMTIFSFHPAKTMTTGEGGMVTTNDPDLYHRLQHYRNNGIERDPQYMKGEIAPWYYEVTDLSGNYNFTEMQAALGLSQLKRLDQFIQNRQNLFQAYKQKLEGHPHIRLLISENENQLARHLCVVHIDFDTLRTTRTAVMDFLRDNGIGSQLHYIPLYRHPFFAKQAGDISEYFPGMELHYARALSLPLYADLTESDVDYVVNTLKKLRR